MTILITKNCNIVTNYDKNLIQITAALFQITTVNYYKLRQPYYKQEVGDDLSVCVVNILPNIIPSLLAINLMKMEI